MKIKKDAECDQMNGTVLNYILHTDTHRQSIQINLRSLSDKASPTDIIFCSWNITDCINYEENVRCGTAEAVKYLSGSDLLFVLVQKTVLFFFTASFLSHWEESTSDSWTSRGLRATVSLRLKTPPKLWHVIWHTGVQSNQRQMSDKILQSIKKEKKKK